MAQWLVQYWQLAVLGAVVAAAAVTDVARGKVYNWLTYPAMAAGLVGHTFVGGLTGSGEAIGLVGAMTGLAVGFLPLLAVWLMGGMGGGDVKLMGAVGALAGWELTLSLLAYSLVAAACIALVIVLQRHVLKRTLRRVGVFLYQVAARGRPIDPADEKSPRVPFGLAVAMGFAVAMVQIIVWGEVTAPFGV